MKFQNKLALFITIIFITAKINLFATEAEPIKHIKYIKLKSEVLHSIDGMPNCIDADAVKNIIEVLQAVKSMTFGEKPKHDASSAAEKSGNYSYRGKDYSVNDLAELEKIAKSTNNIGDLNDLNVVYSKIKSDFIDLTKPFIKDISVPAIKNFMTKLIDESCHERKRFDSYLLTWSRQNGTEIDSLNRDIKDIQAFAVFCNDLCSFLGDLLHSCPKGIAKYKAKYILKSPTN